MSLRKAAVFVGVAGLSFKWRMNLPVPRNKRAGSRSTVPLNCNNSVLFVAPLSAFEIYGCIVPSHEQRISQSFRLVIRRARLCSANLIFTLHEAALIAARRNVMERDIAWHGPKSGMPSPISTGTRVITSRSMNPAARNRWIVRPPSM